MSLLTIVQSAAGLMQLPKPQAVAQSNDPIAQALWAMANEEVIELASRTNWQAMTEEATFVTTGAPVQAGAIPKDFDHFIQGTFWNRSTMRPVDGPMTPQEWQAVQAIPQVGRVILAYRVRGGQFLISPTPPAGQTIAFEYVSTWPCLSSQGQGQPAFLADTDTSYLNEWLITLGVRWRYRKTKGLEYGEDFQTYERQVIQAMARDAKVYRMNLAGGGSRFAANVPQSFPAPAVDPIPSN